MCMSTTVKKRQPVLSLKPTQFSVGLLEVEFKTAELRTIGKKSLRKRVDKIPIPVVVSPWNELCVVDHHHFLFACWHCGVRKVRIEVVRDFSSNNTTRKKQMSYVAFWRKMAKLKYAYLYDQFGQGPRRALYLPMDIRGMADDPYRSLAWMVRKEGGFENSGATFAEFKWADYFRHKGLLDRHGRKGFHSAVRRGLALARSPAARALPGYIGKKANTKVKEEEALSRSKYVPRAQKRGFLATVPLVVTDKQK